MTKKIRMRATARIARDLGYHPRKELVMVEVDIDLDKLSSVARWLAEHVTATYIADEYLDRIDVKAVSSTSDKDIDMYCKRPQEYIEQQEYLWGERYSRKHEIWVTFPIWSKNAPEEVFEKVALQLINAGMAELYVVNNPSERLKIKMRRGC